MGLKPYQIQAALSGVLAQRLARRLCPSCREPVELTSAQLAVVGLQELPATATVYGPRGCQKCNNLGYRGRFGVYEFLEFTPAMKKLSQAESTPDRLMELGMSAGFRTLRECAVDRMLEGATSIAEVVRLSSED